MTFSAMRMNIPPGISLELEMYAGVYDLRQADGHPASSTIEGPFSLAGVDTNQPLKAQAEQPSLHTVISLSSIARVCQWADSVGGVEATT